MFFPTFPPSPLSLSLSSAFIWYWTDDTSIALAKIKTRQRVKMMPTLLSKEDALLGQKKWEEKTSALVWKKIRFKNIRQTNDVVVSSARALRSAYVRNSRPITPRHKCNVECDHRAEERANAREWEQQEKGNNLQILLESIDMCLIIITEQITLSVVIE